MATVLIIDDDLQFRQLVVLAVHPAGHVVVEAGGAREAEKLLLTLKPDLVLIDGLLPDADGSTWIHERRKTVTAPVIFVSAFWKGDRAARELHAKVKPAGFLRKPATPEQILAEIGRVLGTAGAAVPLSASDRTAFDAMRVEYASDLPARLARLRRQLAGVQQRPGDSVLFAETRREAHELAGTAGSFGFDELTVVGNHLERALLKWQTTRVATAWAPIASEIANLEWWEASHPAAA
jgi:CheY-like chemotaxis protein